MSVRRESDRGVLGRTARPVGEPDLAAEVRDGDFRHRLCARRRDADDEGGGRCIACSVDLDANRTERIALAERVITLVGGVRELSPREREQRQPCDDGDALRAR